MNIINFIIKNKKLSKMSNSFNKKELRQPTQLSKQIDKGNLVQFLNEQKMLLKKSQLSFNSNTIDSLFNILNHLVNITCLLSFTSKTKAYLSESQFSQSKSQFHKEVKAFLASIHSQEEDSVSETIQSVSSSAKARQSTSTQASKKSLTSTTQPNKNKNTNGTESEGNYLRQEISNKDVIEKIKKKMKTKRLDLIVTLQKEPRSCLNTKTMNNSKTYFNTISDSENNNGKRLYQRCQSEYLSSRNYSNSSFITIRTNLKHKSNKKSIAEMKLSGFTSQLMNRNRSVIDQYNEIKTQEEKINQLPLVNIKSLK